jgi:hypothetical protein
MTERQIVGTFLLVGSVLLFLVLPLIEVAQPENVGFIRAAFGRAFAPLFLSGLTGFLFLVLPPYRRRD